METIHVLIDADLLEAVDCVARKSGSSRSTLIGHALRGYLAQQRTSDREAADRLGYEREPVRGDDSAWDDVQAWPPD